MLMYHGTDFVGLKKIKPSPKGLFGFGIYLSDDAEDASSYGRHLCVAEVSLERPWYTKADYNLAWQHDCDSPAGPLLLELFGKERAVQILKRLRHTMHGHIGKIVYKQLSILGHDGIVIDWPGGPRHAVAFRSSQVRILDWMEAVYS